MAASRFASMLHRNTDRMTFLLIYTALEWILIIFLFLNAIFSYAIERFTSFFGLKPPCIFCSRIDHLFEPGKGKSRCRDFLCESHAGEVSRLGFCSNHRRLADSGDMCEDCAASKPGETDRSFSLLSWMKRSEQGEKDLRCSCCGVALESGFYSPYLLLKTKSWDVLECIQKEKSEIGEGFELEEVEKMKGKKEEEGRAAVDDDSMDVFVIRAEKTADLERIIPIELIDSSTMVKSPSHDLSTVSEQETVGIPSAEIDRSGIVAAHENHSYVLLPTEDPSDDFSTDLKTMEVVSPVEELQEHLASVEDGKGNDEANCEISIGSEICDQEQIEETQFHEVVSQPDPVSHHQHLNDVAEIIIKDPVVEIEPSEQHSQREKLLKIGSILSEIEEERIMMPDTPTTPSYIDSYHVQHKRFLLERRESGAESFDGSSITGDMDNLESPTIDHLKTALNSERKALIALYAELEEERSASAIAANQTMAMITRLQQEKAAMQMEALQYQRMMEEQSEYDQEAVQLLNELMVKREKEKQELEKKVEAYREKIHVYEAMERRRKSKGSGSGTSSSVEESDELSIESQVGFTGSMEEEEEDDDSDVAEKHLMQFEQERISILGQLKALEEKLLNHSPIENGHGINGVCEFSQKDDNGGSVNGEVHIKSTERNGKRLLPLFDAISLENGDDGDSKKLAIVEQVDQVYERLQALEADSEFLKHCLSSLKKGDRGLDLLQEILQHLRDLRIMEIHPRYVDV